MKESKQVVLYGNSIILGTIGASLKLCSGLEVTALPQKESIWSGSAMIDILIFDLLITRPEEVMRYLDDNSALLLIGINPDINNVQIWSGRQLRELSTQVLLELLNDQVGLKV